MKTILYLVIDKSGFYAEATACPTYGWAKSVLEDFKSNGVDDHREGKWVIQKVEVKPIKRRSHAKTKRS